MTAQWASKVISIYAPSFTAGVVCEDDKVKRAAPIIKYMRGWTLEQVKEYVARRGWQCEEL